MGVGPAGIVTSAEDGFQDLVTNTNFPGIILLGIGAIPCLFLLFRWLFKFNREFTNFYIEENQKLRERVDELETEIHQKDELILEFRAEVGRLKLSVEKQEHTIAYLRQQIGEKA